MKVEARFVTGEYEVVILSATESKGLDTWLRQQKYNIPQGAAEALAPYVRDKSKFFVAKVDIKKVKRDAQGVVQLSPLRFAFDANELRLPVRLGLLNAAGKQDLIVYVIHPTSRFEVANYANTFIPTNLEVADGVRANFPAFFAELFDATVEKMGRKVVVTEYAWQTTGCDPCPTPPLTDADLDDAGPRRARPVGRKQGVRQLGADPAPHPLQQGDADRGPGVPRGEGRRWADAPTGTAPTATRALNVAQEVGATNNFQGRYIIRHYWTKPVACKQPQFDVWGGAPGNRDARPTPTAAKGLATAPRGKVALKDEVRSPVPSLGIPGKPPQRRRTTTP